MSPIRVGIIGLNGDIKPGVIGGQWGLQHVTALKASPHYQVVAVCNSTTASATRAISAHELGPDVKAYGSAEDLANDADVDLVSVIVHVDKHYALAKPAILAGKDLYIEYPTATDVKQVEELTRLAAEKGVRIAVGTQAAADPVARKVKALVRGGTIGDVVVSSFEGQIPFLTADGWGHALAFWLDKDASVSRMTVFLGHSLVSVLDTLGDFTTVQSLLKVQHKTAKLLDDAGHLVDPAYPVTVPDTFLVQGILASGGLASYSLRSARSSVSGVGYRWLISGTDGELELTINEGVLFQNDMAAGDAKIVIRRWGQEAEVVDVGGEEEAHVVAVGDPAKNVARAYEAFAKADEDGYLSIQESVRLHKLLERIAKDAKWAP